MNTIDTILDSLSSFWSKLSELFVIPIFSVGSTSITLSLIFYLIASALLLLFVSRKLRNILFNRILKKYGLEYETSKSIGTIFYYFLISIGFGLQHITNNFISGIIILFERPIQEGDRIEVGSVRGDVVKISARSTTVLTNDNISIIVPTSEFINSKVINWSHNDRNVRFQFPIRCRL